MALIPRACARALTRALRAAPARALSIDASALRGRDLDTMFSFTGDEQRTLLRMAAGLKKRLRAPDSKPYTPLVRSLRARRAHPHLAL